MRKFLTFLTTLRKVMILQGEPWIDRRKDLRWNIDLLLSTQPPTEIIGFGRVGPPHSLSICHRTPPARTPSARSLRSFELWWPL